jgi:hypothetical protein
MSNILLAKSNFIHIPKCGGTTVNTALWRLGLVGNIDRQIMTPHYGHLFPCQMAENENPFFTFVRHPVTWWLSFYHWNMNPEHTRFSGQELDTTSFDEWIRDYGPFWLGHYSMLVRRYTGNDPAFPSTKKVELIGRTESLFRDLRNILNILGEPYKVDVMKDLIAGRMQFNETLANTQTYDRNDVSMESREIIRDCEQYMYTMFGYKV